MRLRVQAPFQPSGDQGQAIEKLAAGIRSGLKFQTLKGVTGSGKTFTMAKVIEELQMPTLVMSHNKTLHQPRQYSCSNRRQCGNRYETSRRGTELLGVVDDSLRVI